MSRINRTNGVGEKASSIPFKNSLTVGTKNILISVHLSSLKKGNKTSLAPCSWLVKNEVIWKAMSAHSDVTKSHIKPCDTHTQAHTWLYTCGALMKR